MVRALNGSTATLVALQPLVDAVTESELAADDIDRLIAAVGELGAKGVGGIVNGKRGQDYTTLLDFFPEHIWSDTNRVAAMMHFAKSLGLRNLLHEGTARLFAAIAMVEIHGYEKALLTSAETRTQMVKTVKKLWKREVIDRPIHPDDIPVLPRKPEGLKEEYTDVYDAAYWTADPVPSQYVAACMQALLDATRVRAIKECKRDACTTLALPGGSASSSSGNESLALRAILQLLSAPSGQARDNPGLEGFVIHEDKLKERRDAASQDRISGGPGTQFRKVLGQDQKKPQPLEGPGQQTPRLNRCESVYEGSPTETSIAGSPESSPRELDAIPGNAILDGPCPAAPAQFSADRHVVSRPDIGQDSEPAESAPAETPDTAKGRPSIADAMSKIEEAARKKAEAAAAVKKADDVDPDHAAALGKPPCAAAPGQPPKKKAKIAAVVFKKPAMSKAEKFPVQVNHEASRMQFLVRILGEPSQKFMYDKKSKLPMAEQKAKTCARAACKKLKVEVPSRFTAGD